MRNMLKRMLAGWIAVMLVITGISFYVPEKAEAAAKETEGISYAQSAEQNGECYVLKHAENVYRTLRPKETMKFEFTAPEEWIYAIDELRGEDADYINPVREGYLFDGWYTEPDGGTKVDLTSFTGEEQMTLYAHWDIPSTELEHGQSVWFEPEGGEPEIFKFTAPADGEYVFEVVPYYESDCEGINLELFHIDDCLVDSDEELVGCTEIRRNLIEGETVYLKVTDTFWHGTLSISARRVNRLAFEYCLPEWVSLSENIMAQISNLKPAEYLAGKLGIKHFPTVLNNIIVTHFLTIDAQGGVCDGRFFWSLLFRGWNTEPDGSGDWLSTGYYQLNPLEGEDCVDRTVYGIFYSTYFLSPEYIPVCVRSGYLLDGYYLSPEGGEKVGETIEIDGNTVLYAAWKKAPVTQLTLGTVLEGSKGYREGNSYLYEFTAPTEGTYIFEIEGSLPTLCELYRNEELTECIDSQIYSEDETKNCFCQLSLEMNANEKVYVTVRAYQSVNAGQFSIWAHKDKYIIFYDADTGSNCPDVQEVLPGETAALSGQIPLKILTLTYDGNEGEVDAISKSMRAKFRSWNTAADGSGTAYLPGEVLTAEADLTLYAQWNNPKAGTLETPTRDGYDFDGWYTAAEGGEKVTAETVVTDSMTLYAHWTEVSEPPVKEMNFKDVNPTDWYYSYVQEAYTLGIMTGNSSGTLFTPDGNMSRGMVVNVMYRMDGEPSVSYKAGFKDVDEKKYYAESINWAVENGIVKGYSDNTFRPDDNITREQIIILLYSYAKVLGMDISGAADLSVYADSSKINSYAAAPMSWAVQNGIISGSASSKQLNPQAKVTRAQAARILMEFRRLKEAAGK